MKLRSALSIMLVALTLLCLCLPMAADDTIRVTVNIANARQNVYGLGYTWENKEDVLTLQGLRIETDDAYGLRLPKYCTVVLKGDNYIKADQYGISCSGTVVFKGSGSLTIEAGDIGIYLISQDDTQKVRLIEGSYTIKAGSYGIYSDAADFSFVGDRMSVSVEKEDGYAIYGRAVNLLGGAFEANASVATTHQLLVDGLKLDVESTRPALSSKNLTVKNLSSSYDGENALHAVSTRKEVRPSILFGESVPAWVDYVLLTIVALCLVAAVVIPVLRKKKKTEELNKRLEAEGYAVMK